MFSSSARHRCIREPPAFAKVLDSLRASMIVCLIHTPDTPNYAGVPLVKYLSLELLIMRSVDWRKDSSHFHR